MPLPPKKDHRISLDDAAKAVGRHRAAQRAAAAHGRANPAAKAKGPYGFHATAFQRILSQPGCVGIRIYPSLYEDGTESLVLVGIDAQGNDMTAGELSNEPWECPPYCPPTDSPLTTGG
jgi:hypothetical protein